MSVLIEVVLPVIFVFVIGYVIQRWRQMELRSISSLAIYVLVPCLILTTFQETEMNMDLLYMVIFSIVFFLVLLLINKGYARIRKLPPNTESGLILATAFMNSGNYGVPVILFAFGNTGFAYAVIFMVIQTLMMSVLGIYYAAKGSTGIRTALYTLLKMPATYATMIAILLNILNIKIPSSLYQPIELISEAAIPVVMVLLGMQLANIKLNEAPWSHITYAVLLRLVVSPIIAFILTSFMPISTMMQQVLIIATAMPAAATTTMYAVQFDAEPKLVSSITLVSTLLSVISITVLLIFIG
ncbi:AEC family transporter [Texcoconibacillus texcoconensis]|uniref:Transporter n=1 Tax=Texcoconibacillus texcoconensis TaxID=1095777 RepID=A0A840QQG4_9BACI|nr:AEC family transporter [Texcoconibacillus texcoconensis]MBB5173600.1 hypothetical protein [Texcoconibacillus texcoconensis]